MSLDADSDDFELKLNTEASDEVALGAVPKDKDKSGSDKRGASGINVRAPADSGISLEKGKGKEGDKPAAKKTESDSDVDFELTLDSSTGASGVKLSGLKGKTDPDSDSEFELTLDDSGGSSIEHAALGAAEEAAEKGDIFETDFEIPPMEAADSGSEAVALESDTDLEKSDFDVAIGDSDLVSEETSGSEVVLLEEEAEGPKAKKKGKGKKAADEEADVDLADAGTDEEEESASRRSEEQRAAVAMWRKKRKRRPLPHRQERIAPFRRACAGDFPHPRVPFMLVGGVMAYQLLETMWGYQHAAKADRTARAGTCESARHGSSRPITWMN